MIKTRDLRDKTRSERRERGDLLPLCAHDSSKTELAGKAVCRPPSCRCELESAPSWPQLSQHQERRRRSRGQPVAERKTRKKEQQAKVWKEENQRKVQEIKDASKRDKGDFNEKGEK